MTDLEIMQQVIAAMAEARALAHALRQRDAQIAELQTEIERLTALVAKKKC